LVADDPSALEEAYRLYAARCNAIAYRVLGNDEAARDAVQEAFLSLWRHRRGLVVRTAGVGPWLAVVVRNAAIAMLRSASARTRREDSIVDSQKTVPDPADAVSRKIDTDALTSALSELPPDQKTVIELAYFKFMTMSQIAQRTEAPVGTVKRRAQLALRQLGKLINERTS
jgi:RNA polymerase sigma-70 factor (ECF subfamily)